MDIRGVSEAPQETAAFVFLTLKKCRQDAHVSVGDGRGLQHDGEDVRRHGLGWVVEVPLNER